MNKKYMFCNIVELEVEILRYKAQGRVLGCANLVSRIVGGRVSLFVAFRCWQRQVEVDSAASVIFLSIRFGAVQVGILGPCFLAQRVSLLLCRPYPPVQAFFQRMPLVVCLGTFCTMCRPSYALHGICNLALLRRRLRGHGRDRRAVYGDSGELAGLVVDRPRPEEPLRREGCQFACAGDSGDEAATLREIIDDEVAGLQRKRRRAEESWLGVLGFGFDGYYDRGR